MGHLSGLRYLYLGEKIGLQYSYKKKITELGLFDYKLRLI